MLAIRTVTHPAERAPATLESKCDTLLPHLVAAGTVGRGALDTIKHIQVTANQALGRHAGPTTCSRDLGALLARPSHLTRLVLALLVTLTTRTLDAHIQLTPTCA